MSITYLIKAATTPFLFDDFLDVSRPFQVNRNTFPFLKWGLGTYVHFADNSDNRKAGEMFSGHAQTHFDQNTTCKLPAN